MKVASHSIVNEALLLFGSGPRLVLEHSLLVPALPQRVYLPDLLVQQRICSEYLLDLLFLDLLHLFELLPPLLLLSLPLDLRVLPHQLQIVLILVVIDIIF